MVEWIGQNKPKLFMNLSSCEKKVQELRKRKNQPTEIMKTENLKKVQLLLRVQILKTRPPQVFPIRLASALRTTRLPPVATRTPGTKLGASSFTAIRAMASFRARLRVLKEERHRYVYMHMLFVKGSLTRNFP